MELDNLFTTEHIMYAIFAILAVIVAFILIKKVAGCLIRTVIFLIMLAALAYIYMNYIDKGEEEGTDQQQIEYNMQDQKA